MKQGLIDAGTRKPDLVILDLGLPDGDGVDFIRDFRGVVVGSGHRAVGAHRRDRQDRGARRRRRRLPDQAVRRGRAAGARARDAAPKRAAAAETAAPFRFGDVEVDLVATRGAQGRCAAASDADRVPAARAADRQRRARCSRTARSCAKSGDRRYVEHDHYVRVYMGHLRQKLEDDPAQPRHLLTETAVGYRLVP